MVILVSALFDGINERGEAMDYLARGREFLALPFQKIIFTNVSDIPAPAGLNTIINVTNIKFAGEFAGFSLFTNNQRKDTLKYMFLMNHKTKFMRRAIEMRPDENQFMWIDFGLSYIFSDADNFRVDRGKIYDKIRIGNIWSLGAALQWDNLRAVNWFFAGGVFGGSRAALIEFCDLCDFECFRIIREHETMIWEVNIWFNVYRMRPDLFSLYTCNHDDTILLNY